MAKIYDPEEIRGSVEINLKEGETPTDVREAFSHLVRKKFRDKGQRIKSLQLELFEETPNGKKVIFHYVAEVYDYDFGDNIKFWIAYGKMLSESY